MFRLFALCALFSVTGCASLFGPPKLPKTLGEYSSNFGYVPVDPLPIDQRSGADSCSCLVTCSAIAADGKPDTDCKDGKKKKSPCCEEKVFMPIPEALPDIAIRFAVAKYSGNGLVSFGSSQTTAKGEAYRAVLDYVNVDEVPVTFWIKKVVALKREARNKRAPTDAQESPVEMRLSDLIDENHEVIKYIVIRGQADDDTKADTRKEAVDTTSQTYLNSHDPASDNILPLIWTTGGAASSYNSVASLPMSNLEFSIPVSTEGVSGTADTASTEKVKSGEEGEDLFESYTFPVYLGVGMRLTADIRALKSGVQLNGLGAIGVAADTDAITGTLTVQTLGVSGKSIATALPLPAKLDQTTIEQSILAIGTSRALLYNQSDRNLLQARPRVVGIYSPVGSDPKLINAIYSELSNDRVKWHRPCWKKAVDEQDDGNGTSEPAGENIG